MYIHHSIKEIGSKQFSINKATITSMHERCNMGDVWYCAICDQFLSSYETFILPRGIKHRHHLKIW